MVFNLKWGILDSVWFLCALKGKIITKRPDTILSAISGFVGIKYKYIMAKLAVIEILIIFEPFTNCFCLLVLGHFSNFV